MVRSNECRWWEVISPNNLCENTGFQSQYQNKLSFRFLTFIVFSDLAKTCLCLFSILKHISQMCCLSLWPFTNCSICVALYQTIFWPKLVTLAVVVTMFSSWLYMNIVPYRAPIGPGKINCLRFTHVWFLHWPILYFQSNICAIDLPLEDPEAELMLAVYQRNAINHEIQCG